MLTWEFPPRIVGGISRHCFGLAKAIAKRGHEIHVITLDFPNTPQYEEIDGVKIYRTSIELGHPNFIIWTFLFNHFMEKKVAVLNREYGFNIIHIHDWLTAPVGITSKYHLDRPLISTIHSTEVGRVQGLYNPDSHFIDGLEWWTTYESKRVIVASNSMKYELEDHFHLPGEKIDVIPNAIDTTRYDRNVDREAVKRRYGISPYERIVLFIGRLSPQKGVEYLIKAVPFILNRHPEAVFIIIGEGLSKEYLMDLAHKSGYSHKIRFFGFLPDQDLIELTMSADVLVLPSIYEPFGIVALEGMAAGVPIVASNVGGLTEIVEHDKTGVLVYPRDPASIAWGVNRVLSDPGYSSWIVQNAKKKVKEVYNWESVAARTIEVYEKALNEW